MKRLKLSGPDRWITNRFSSKRIDEKTRLQQKIYWVASLSVTIMIGILVLTYHLVFPDLRILIWYGLFLILLFLQGVIMPLISKGFLLTIWWQFFNQTLIAIATFVAVIKLGGIPYSGGLVLVGLALVFFSLNFEKRAATIAIFVIHIISVIFMALLHPLLTVPPEMTPAVNISLYAINIIWISGFAFAFVMNFISQRVKLEKNETEKIKVLNEARNQLFTNITHEFRTPLTVIKSMTELLREQPGKWREKGIEKIDRNADQLLYLVNQMLDLSRLESGAMPLHMISSRINIHIRHFVEMQESFAASRQIRLEFIPCNEDLVMDFDPEKLSAIISNLVHNAIKFNAPGGEVTVRSELTSQDTFTLQVSDNGPGIPPESTRMIFERFYRIDNNEMKHQPGSGLGLALVREMVKLLEGEIEVDSKLGEGTIFTLKFPFRKKHPFREPVQPEVTNGSWGTAQKQTQDNRITSTENHTACEDAKDRLYEDKIPLLLIVEDNRDVVEYLSEVMGSDYRILTAKNGKEGFEKAVSKIPDIIISDIMMPVMDGIELLERLKKDWHTSHIPVIMLTAKADIASRIKGLYRGADAYLSKPFNRNELMVQAHALIDMRIKLRERYANIENYQPSEDSRYRIEDAFMNKIRKTLIEHLHEEYYSIHQLCREIGMSRTQLYRKFNSLSDQTVSLYFRALRLQKAKELLLNSELTVSEVAYRTGFKNISHFSKVFKEEFNVCPSKYFHA